MCTVWSTDGSSAEAPEVPELIRKQDHTLVQSSEMGGQESMSSLLSSFPVNRKILQVFLCVWTSPENPHCVCENSDKV